MASESEKWDKEKHMDALEIILQRLKKHQSEGKKVLSIDYLIEMVDKDMRKRQSHRV
jgi:endo-alpha-1,4-polygalactosaminidase (GH114 family)